MVEVEKAVWWKGKVRRKDTWSPTTLGWLIATASPSRLLTGTFNIGPQNFTSFTLSPSYLQGHGILFVLRDIQC